MAKTKAQKRTEAEARRAEYNRLTLDEKLRRCQAARGKSAKQIQRLKKQSVTGATKKQ